MQMKPWEALGTAADVGDTMQLRTLGRKRIIVLRVDGEIRAFDALCPHLGGPLERGDLVGATVTCPLHGWRFDIRKAGEETHGFACLRTFPVREDGNQLLVQL